MKVLTVLFFTLSLIGLNGCSNDKVADDAPLPGSHAAMADAAPRIVADGWTPELSFEVPEPGSYSLSKIKTAGGGLVLDKNGSGLDLDSLLGDKIVLLTFIYSSCVDLNGCPLATAVFYKIKERFKEDPRLQDQIRLISISFDPEHDTPEVMRLYGAGFDDGDPQWLFLTTASEEALHPVIEQYGQTVIRMYDEEGGYTGSMAHVLRAFLIDRSKNIRQEYSVSFLHDKLVTVDIKTLLMEEGILLADEVMDE